MSDDFVPFDYEGISDIERSAEGVEAVYEGVVVRVALNSGGPPRAELGRYGPRGGWIPWIPQGNAEQLSDAALVLLLARELVAELDVRWRRWMEANGR